MSEHVQSLLAEVKAKNPAEPEFHQAVQEVADSLSLVLERHPEYRHAKVLERVIEPERVRRCASWESRSAPTSWVRGLECQRMELGEPNASGRRKPVAVQGTEFVLEVQTVIEAIGQKPNPIVQSTTPGLAVGRRGTVQVDDIQHTNLPGVFAGGDLSRGGATVILAMRDGRRAAAAIHEYLRELKPEEDGPPLLLQVPAREA